jgi:hypothetical protein
MDNQISFSTWVKWEERRALDTEQGVYLWGRFPDNKPSETSSANPIQENVIYVGESCKGQGCFRKRWDLFDEGLTYPDRVQANPKHYPRAKIYLENFGPDKTPLYVATITIQKLMQWLRQTKHFNHLDITNISLTTVESFDENNRDLLVRYIERLIILSYAIKNHKKPIINKE